MQIDTSQPLSWTEKYCLKVKSYKVTYVTKLDTSSLGLELIFEASMMTFLVMKLSL